MGYATYGKKCVIKNATSFCWFCRGKVKNGQKGNIVGHVTFF